MWMGGRGVDQVLEHRREPRHVLRHKSPHEQSAFTQWSERYRYRVARVVVCCQRSRSSTSRFCGVVGVASFDVTPALGHPSPALTGARHMHPLLIAFINQIWNPIHTIRPYRAWNTLTQ